VLDELAVLRRYARFTLAFTVMRTNVDEIEACARLAHEVGADTAVFRPLYPVGIAQHHMELMPSFAEYNTARNTLAQMDSDVLDLRQIDPFGPYSRAETQSVVHQNYGCGAGNLVCSISVSGDVNPCSFLGPGFVAANIRDSSLAQIWQHSAGFRAIRPLPQGSRPVDAGTRQPSAAGSGPGHWCSTGRSTHRTRGSPTRYRWNGKRWTRFTIRWRYWTSLAGAAGRDH
jgi:[mycofactocin precursor peptide]-tyrosine decarboxylase / 3-amino-5-[(4-hydroxyphenyl)methyl]-4,4-dimethylpyrrolidin-2-one synthase